MTGQEALNLVDALLQAGNSGQALNNLQSEVFLKTWTGYSYREIAQELGYEYDYIKQVGSQLWRSLSQAVGEPVCKFNIQAVVRRYQQSKKNEVPCCLFPVPFEYKQESGQALNIAQFYGFYDWQDVGINLCKIEENSPTSMLDPKLTQLKTIFAEMEWALIAYSGGVDSTLVAKIAYDVLGDRALAVTAQSPSLLPEELEEACVQAAMIGIPHEVIQTHEMDNPNYTSNPINRCYFCKSELHDTLKPLALQRGYPYVVDGVNADDLGDYRPGIQAAKERGARSPLAEVGITKLEVRELSKELGLSWWDKPAQPCLSSRFPYGEEITVGKLQRVGRAEIYLRKLGLKNLRVRSEGDTARIELPPEEIKEFVLTTDLSTLVSIFQEFGFMYVTLDLEGYRSGKLNQVLTQNLMLSGHLNNSI